MIKNRFFLLFLILQCAVFIASAAVFAAAPASLIESDLMPAVTPADANPKKVPYLPGGRIRMSGHYRLAAAAQDEKAFIYNDANGDLQERDFHYLFGERMANTYDPGIYDQFLLNVDFKPVDRWNFHTQIVADPWSLTGTSGEQIINNQNGQSTLRPNFKYFGADNSVLNEIYRSNTGDSVALPLTKVTSKSIA